MKRPLHIWLGFAICLGVVLAAMGWISNSVLRLDAAESENHRHAILEENVRLALWRMDSALAPLIAQESARTYFAYRPFYPAERAYNRMFAELDFGEVLMPSDLLNRASPLVLLHFQFDPEGKLTSPQVPTGNELDLAEGAQITTWQEVATSRERLCELQKQLDRKQLIVALQNDTPLPATPLPSTVQLADTLQSGVQQLQQQIELNPNEGQQGAQQNVQRQVLQTDNNDQFARNSVEFNKRAQSTRLGNGYRGGNDLQYAVPQGANPPAPNQPPGNQPAANPPAANQPAFGQSPAKPNMVQSKSTPPMEIREGVARPLWIGQALVLARRVSVGGKEYIQGCWLDWPAIRDWLATDVIDLLPSAQLLPVAVGEFDPAARRLAALPVHLVPGEVLTEPAPYWTPMRLSLAVAWSCVLLAAAAVAVLLAGVVSLSERRGAFVSAVTHELRTPLTTFRMYTEMLADGMVRDEAQRKQYLTTLQTEAGRLAHLVENVLAYARIERGSLAGRRERMTGEKLLSRVEPRLLERAGQADFKLVVEATSDALAANASCDASAVEQILFNLVDNACKYAHSASVRKIHLMVERQGKTLALRVRDHGPGISVRERWRLFRPFSKSATDAAHTAPGVGLGLSLCRRLARDMRGDLKLCDAHPDGACFLLTLPIEG